MEVETELKVFKQIIQVEESSIGYIEIGRLLHLTVYSNCILTKLRGRGTLAAIENAELMEVKN